MLTVIRKRPEVSTEQFRHFMEFEYGPTYAALPQTREYVQYYLTDTAADGAEDPIDAKPDVAHMTRSLQDQPNAVAGRWFRNTAGLSGEPARGRSRSWRNFLLCAGSRFSVSGWPIPRPRGRWAARPRYGGR
jgi:hypothetical protein